MLIRLLALVLLLVSAAACGDDEPVTPTQPTPLADVTEEMTGTLTVNGGRTHPFNTGGSGDITATVTELTPDSTAEIGVSLGTWNGATCQIVIARDRASTTAVVIGRASAAGSYCMRVYDAGELKATTNYKVTVVHK